MHRKEEDKDVCHWEKGDRTGDPVFPLDGDYCWKQGPALGKMLKQAEEYPH